MNFYNFIANFFKGDNDKYRDYNDVYKNCKTIPGIDSWAEFYDLGNGITREICYSNFNYKSIYEAFYKNGKLDGSVKFWNNDKLTEHKIYKNGCLIETVYKE